MAAKVVMVAVPTVLGIASIRVYTVKETPTDGVVTRERLNIYTPLQSSKVQFVPESPGVIERGLTTVRQTVVPVVHAVKAACVSVKRGSVTLYHAGEDVYYYLKDPPPGFLPRLGTITMAGLLGMFLARKGSRFKRVAVPLGLMSAGTSVCYPAQAVAVLKVTGKKVYAAGQWSSSAVSSLLTSKEPVAKEIVASQPQSATEPNPDTSSPAAQSSTILETEVESAESVPDEPIVAVITEKQSSITLTEISPDQTPTETSSENLVTSVLVETPPSSQELPAQVESEDAKQAGEIPSTEATASSETIEANPVESVSAEAAPVESVSAEAAPVESVSAEAAPVESVSAEAAPVEPAAAEAAPVESVSAEAAPVESVSAESTPVQPAEIESALSSGESSVPKDEPAVPVVESAELSDQPPVTGVGETLAPSSTEPPVQQLATKEGSGFKPDASLMDFGQSNPEDEDLYSTRS